MRIRVLSAFLAATIATPALAQDEAPTPEQAEVAKEARARLTIAAGGVWLPDYEGSDDNRWVPALSLIHI